MSPRQKNGLTRAICAFVLFSGFFTVVAAMFVDPAPIDLGPIHCSRQVIAAFAIYAHGVIVAWIEYRRGIASWSAPPSDSP